MNVNHKFMTKVENEGININIGDIIITQCNDKESFFFNYVIEKKHEIYLIDLKTGIEYAQYSDLDALKSNLQRGFIRTYDCRIEMVLNIIKNNIFIGNLETMAKLFL